MKILLITDNHSPEGGAERYFFDLKERLKKVPHLNVFSLGFSAIKSQGPDFITFKAARSNWAKLIWRFLFNPMVYFQLRRQIKKFRPDVIHIHNIKQYPLSLSLALKGERVVQTVHDYSYICPTAQNIHQNLEPCPTGLRKSCFWEHQVKYNRYIYLVLVASFALLRKQFRKTVAVFIAPSPLLVDFLKQNGFSRALYIPPFIPTLRPISFDEMKPSHFLFAGNLGTHKGVYLLLDEFALACKKQPDLFLSIAGSGPEKSRMEEHIQRLGLQKNVRFLGWQTQMDAHYKEANALIFPSIGMESFGLVLTEAMSHARAVIGINRGTAAWIIDDKRTGLLFNPLKKGDLAEKIVLLATDRELTKNLGQAAHSTLQQNFDNERTLKQIVEVYQTV